MKCEKAMLAMIHEVTFLGRPGDCDYDDADVWDVKLSVVSKHVVTFLSKVERARLDSIEPQQPHS